jgi:hypothetical protein
MRDYGATNAAPYASAPAVGAVGDTYWDSTTKVLYVSDGTAWVANVADLAVTTAKLAVGATTPASITTQLGANFPIPVSATTVLQATLASFRGGLVLVLWTFDGIIQVPNDAVNTQVTFTTYVGATQGPSRGLSYNSTSGSAATLNGVILPWGLMFAWLFAGVAAGSPLVQVQAWRNTGNGFWRADRGTLSAIGFA